MQVKGFFLVQVNIVNVMQYQRYVTTYWISVIAKFLAEVENISKIARMLNVT